MSAFSDSVERQWYSRPHWLLLMAPLSLLFIVLARLRRYKFRLMSPARLQVPVVVIGNISVGGTGKTPLIMSLVKELNEQGFHPGVIARGYGAKIKKSVLVSADANPYDVGDEPLLLAQTLACPVVVGPNRVESAEYLINEMHSDIILSDDGLQHYALARDIEIVVIDSNRQLGNGWRLPVGPLRESKKRLREVDFVLLNGTKFSAPWLPEDKAWNMTVKPKAWRNVKTDEVIALDQLNIQGAQAVAGIGNPERFFTTLKALGFEGKSHSFADHHRFSEFDFVGLKGALLMTEKDAVKCKPFAKNDWWALCIELDVDQSFINQFIRVVKKSRLLGSPLP